MKDSVKGMQNDSGNIGVTARLRGHTLRSVLVLWQERSES